MRFCIVNETTEEKLTTDLLVQIAGALTSQQQDFANWWQSYPIPITLVGTRDHAPADACLVILADELEVEGAYGYHDVDDTGRPRIFVGWHVVRDNGGTLYRGSQSLSVTMSHEVLEATADPYASFWADRGNSVDEVALEVCDPVEGDSYEIGGISVSSFVGPKWFSLENNQRGAYDRLGRLSAPMTMSDGGYLIVRTGGPGGPVKNIFGSAMPAWKRPFKGSRRV